MRVERRRLWVPPEGGAAEAPQGSGARTTCRAKTVLIVDDHDDNRELFAAVLRDQGAVVTTATDGVDGLEAAARDRPDVILMDLAMPRMDGFSAIERLRLDEHGRHAYIIVISAFSDSATRTRIEELGADAFLPKPCDPRTLIAAVSAAFAGSGPPRAAAG
jgi:CheY-like chemotaxis protein